MAKEEKAPKPVAIAPVDGEVIQSAEEAVQETAVATRAPMAMGQASGEVGQSDITYPTVRIIQKMSENLDKLDEGTLTLDNTTVIQNAKGKARLTVVSIQKYYKEVLPFGAGTPREFYLADEAVAAGFRIARSAEDRNAGVPIVEDAARAVVLVEKPEGAMDRAFPYELDGVRVMPAIWYIQSSSYRAVAKTIFSKMAFELRATGLLPAIWELAADKVKGKQGEYYTPRLTLISGERSAKFIEDLKNNIKV